MVKANAYGHGAVKISKRLAKINCKSFAVSTVDEGVQLRKNGIENEVIVLGYIEDFKRAKDYDLTPVIYNDFSAKKAGKYKMASYLKVDTGMSRLGFIKDCDYKNILKQNDIIGMFSHLSCADSKNPNDISFTRRQIDSFKRIEKVIENECGHKTKNCLLNTAGAILYKDYFDSARIGIGLYGINPSKDVIDTNLLPIMTVKCTISSIKVLDSGSFISYGRTYTLPRRSKIAVITMGYADGLPRAKDGTIYVEVNKKLSKVLGLVTMDQSMIDVTDIDCDVGDEVVIFGNLLGIENFAYNINKIPYEILTGLSHRVKRIYK